MEDLDRWIVDARVGDAEFIAKIYNQYVGQDRFTMDEEPWKDSSVVEMIEKIAGGRGVCLLVGEGEQRVGWGVIKPYSARSGYRFACEVSLYLDAQRTKKGLGALLMQALLNRAIALSYRHVVAKIFEDNTKSIRFHERFGFSTVGTQQQIGFLNGQWKNVVIMQNVISTVTKNS